MARYKRFNVPVYFELKYLNCKEKQLDFFTEATDYNVARCLPFFHKKGLYIDRELDITWIELEEIAFTTDNDYSFEFHYYNDPKFSKEDLNMFRKIFPLLHQ